MPPAEGATRPKPSEDREREREELQASWVAQPVGQGHHAGTEQGPEDTDQTRGEADEGAAEHPADGGSGQERATGGGERV